jgi:hypothetical protein
MAQTATRERLIGTEIVVPVAPSEMILQSKTAADRPKDHRVLDRMRDILNPLRPPDLLTPPDRSRSRGEHEPPRAVALPNRHVVPPILRQSGSR